MKVGIDARSVTGPRGVTRYTTELLRALVRAFPDDRFVLFVPGHGELPAIADLLTASNVSVYRHVLPSRALFGCAAVLRRPRLERLIGEPLDVVWVPAPAPVALVGEVPAVLTLHDVTWEERPARLHALRTCLAPPRATSRARGGDALADRPDARRPRRADRPLGRRTGARARRPGGRADRIGRGG